MLLGQKPRTPNGGRLVIAASCLGESHKNPTELPFRSHENPMKIRFRKRLGETNAILPGDNGGFRHELPRMS